jgi:predicted esterase
MRSRALTAFIAVLGLTGASRADEGKFQDRPYRLDWPTGEVSGVLVYLHGVCGDAPLKVERGQMDAVAREANGRGRAALFATGLRGRGYLPAPQKDAFCWSHLDIGADLDYVGKLIHMVEETKKVSFATREIVGFSNGAYLLGGALQRGMLSGYARVGLIAGGGIGDPPPNLGVTRPEVFVEVGTDDVWNLEPVRRLVKRLEAADYGTRLLHVRERAGGHAVDATRMTAFLGWLWGGP